MRFSIPAYVPSQRPGLFTVVLAPLLLASAILMGALYQRLLYVLPLQFLQFFFPALVSLGFGMLCARVLEYGPCRSPGFGRTLLGVAVLVMWATSWATAFLRNAQAAYPELDWSGLLAQMDLGTLTNWVEARYDAGWKDGRRSTRGVVVGLAWAVEFAVMFIVTAWVTRPALERLFCEPCHRWLDTRGVSCHGLTAADALPLIEAGDLARLLELRPREDGVPDMRVALMRHQCSECRQTTYLSVDEVRTVPTRFGTQDKRHALLRNAVLPDALVRRLDARVAEIDAPAPEAPPAMPAM